MNILICDDSKPDIAKLEKLLKDSGFDVKTKSFTSGYDVLEHVRSGAVVDLCILDILMPEISGIKLARQLRADGFNGEIVFLSASNEYAAQSYEVNAFYYILKPTRPDSLRVVLEKLESKRNKNDAEGLFIKVSKVSRYVLFRDISHIEVMKHYVYFRLTDGEEIKIYAVFAEISERLLSDARFARCHRSYIINLSDVAAIDERNVTMRDGIKIPYSKSYSGIKKRFAKYIMDG